MMSNDPGRKDKARAAGFPRRDFLAGAAALAAAGAAAAGDEPKAGPKAELAGQPLPTIQLGKHRISRLVVGSNPLLGYSYLGHHTDQHMREYFTAERTVEFLLRCEREGITCHQSASPQRQAPILKAAREKGSKMSLILLHSGRAAIKGDAALVQPIAMVHHGGATDRCFRENRSGEVRDYVKAVHDAGLLAGVSAHNPDCIKRIADEGWEVDFFMTCFYYLTRRDAPACKEEIAALPTLDIAYPFYKNDPAVMTAVVRQVKQPCLGFKILAAGRRCESQPGVREAFRYAFANIKPTDGVIVGMYPRFFDEVRANAQYAREFGAIKT